MPKGVEYAVFSFGGTWEGPFCVAERSARLTIGALFRVLSTCLGLVLSCPEVVVSFQFCTLHLWRSVPQRWLRWLLLVPLLLLTACAGPIPGAGWRTSGSVGPASYQQCVNPYGASNPACVAAGVSTGEALAPAAVRVGQAAGTAVRAAEVLQGLITLHRFLTDSERKIVEGILKDCVKEANTKVDDELFGKGRSLPDSECKKPPVVRKKLAPTWRRHLGILKHAAAFECIDRQLSTRFPGSFSIEPRYRKDEISGETLLTDRWEGSLRPDLVLHFTRDAARIQCIYDLKFPCGYETANPWNASVEHQMKQYGDLGGGCPVAIVTPAHGVQYK